MRYHEYKAQDEISKVVSTVANVLTVEDYIAMDEAAYDDHGYPISGDHLPRRE